MVDPGRVEERPAAAEERAPRLAGQAITAAGSEHECGDVPVHGRDVLLGVGRLGVEGMSGAVGHGRLTGNRVRDALVGELVRDPGVEIVTAGDPADDLVDQPGPQPPPGTDRAVTQEQTPPGRGAVGVGDQHRFRHTRIAVGDGVAHGFEPVHTGIQHTGAGEDAQARPAGVVGARPLVRVVVAVAGRGEHLAQCREVGAGVGAQVVRSEQGQQACRVGVDGARGDIQQRRVERSDLRRARMPAGAQGTAVGGDGPESVGRSGVLPPETPSPGRVRVRAGLGEGPERASPTQPAQHRVGAVRHDVPAARLVGDVGEQQLRPADHPAAGIRVEPGPLGVVGQGLVQPVVAGELGLRRQPGHQRCRHGQHGRLDGKRIAPSPLVEARLRPGRAVDHHSERSRWRGALPCGS